MNTYHKVVVIEASTVCNLSCPFCAYDSRLQGPRFTLNREILRAFIEAVGKYSAAKNETILISWLGGEPLLNKSVLLITNELKGSYPLCFSATTNGTRLLNRAIRAHIRDHYSELTISLDGFSTFHDKMRGRDGLFEEIREGIDLLVQEAPDLKIRINALLMRSNFDSFHDLCLEVAGWGVKEITFNQLGGRDRPEFYPPNRLSFEQACLLPNIVNDIQTAIDSRGVKLIFSESYHRRILASTQGIKLPVLDCQPGTYYLFVSARGRIAPCSFTTDEYGVDISQIQTAEAFGKLPLSFSREKAERQALPCHDCPNTNVHGKFS